MDWYDFLKLLLNLFQYYNVRGLTGYTIAALVTVQAGNKQAEAGS